MSVEETLGAVFDTSKGGGYGSRWELFRKANVDAKPALYRILANTELSSYHPNAWRILGYIGDGDDAGRL